jgi:hypothetical protein
VLHQTEGTGCVLGSGRRDARWLPDGWDRDAYPTGWTLAHLERWFDCALQVAQIDDRGDIPDGRCRLGKNLTFI